MTAFEIEPSLAVQASHNLADFGNVVVRQENAVRSTVPQSDIIYVNAGLAVPPVHWLEALKPGGRLIMPWRPSPHAGIALLIRRVPGGYAADALIPSWFIPLVDAPQAPANYTPPPGESLWTVKSVHLARDRPADDSAVAVFDEVWFSADPMA